MHDTRAALRQVCGNHIGDYSGICVRLSRQIGFGFKLPCYGNIIFQITGCPVS